MDGEESERETSSSQGLINHSALYPHLTAQEEQPKHVKDFMLRRFFAVRVSICTLWLHVHLMFFRSWKRLYNICCCFVKWCGESLDPDFLVEVFFENLGTNGYIILSVICYYFLQSKKQEKHPRRSVTFSKVGDWSNFWSMFLQFWWYQQNWLLPTFLKQLDFEIKVLSS